MNIAFVISDNYTIYLYVAMASILKNSNASDKFNFFVFHNGMQQTNRDEILRLKRIKDFNVGFYQVDFESELKDFWPWTLYNSRLCYYRLLLPLKMSELNIDKYLYIDADIIVNGSISEMYNSDLDGHAMGLVPIPIIEEEKDIIARLGLAKGHKYTYSGLMLVDVDKYIKEDFYNRALAIAKAQTEAFYWPDMDMLNVLCQTNNYAAIPPKYSINPGYEGANMDLANMKLVYRDVCKDTDIEEAYSNPVIWQLAGGAKPCADCSLPKIRKLFYRYAKGSRFSKQAKKWLGKSLIKKIGLLIFRISKKRVFGKEIKIFKLFGIPLFGKSKVIYDIPKVELSIDSNVKCLVIAPHPDDEIIGMGGVLVRYASNFDALCVSSSGVTWAGKSGKERSDIRIKEFAQVMHKLGIKDYKIFETYGDFPPFIDQIKKHFNDYLQAFDFGVYDYIFVPHPRDGHPEHQFLTNRLLKGILHKSKYKKDLKIVFYEVWAPLSLVNCYVNIEKVMSEKLEVLKMYHSQIDEIWNYPRWVEGLNTYRAMNLVPAKYAEAFYVCKVKDYLRMKGI